MPRGIGAGIPAAMRLNANVDKSGGPDACWPWTASRKKFGHGQIMVDGKMWLSHRLAYIVEHGPIDEDICVLHRCDNPPCCNPRHLFLGTRGDNIADMMSKGRYDHNGKRHWHRGAKHANARLTEEKVREIRALYEQKKATQEELATMFGVGQTTISNVLLRKVWRHV